MKEINQATHHLIDCIIRLESARHELHENEENSGACSPYIQERIYELDAILDDLQELQTYLENTDFTA